MVEVSLAPAIGPLLNEPTKNVPVFPMASTYLDANIKINLSFEVII